MSIIVQVPVQIPEDDWADMIFGSGFTQYPWWNDVSFDRDAGILSGLVLDQSANEEGVYVGFQVTLQELADAASVLAKRNNRFAVSLTEQDLDADDADQVVQECVLGEQVYG